MTPERRLMCVLAHPDHETLGTGGVLAKYASEGVATYVVTATRGERGRYGDEESPGPDVVGRARQRGMARLVDHDAGGCWRSLAARVARGAVPPDADDHL